jgi:hypothetical protein
MQSFHDALRAAGLLVLPISDNEKALDTKWRTLTEAGNRAQERGDHVGALQFYEAALTEAARMLAAAIDGGSPLLAPMLYNISCANQAETVLQTGDSVSARRLLLQAFEKLLAVAGCPASPIALRINCVRHLGYSLTILARDFCDGTEQPETERLVARATAVAVDVGRIMMLLNADSGRDEKAETSHRIGRLH